MAQDRAAREFKVECGPRSYTVRIPTDHEQELAWRRCRPEQPMGAFVAEFWRELSLVAVVGWSGVKAGDLSPDAPKPDDSVRFSAAGVGFLLDKLPDDAAKLGEAFAIEFAKRKTEQEDAAKN
jgi:hypothetical protein